MNETISNLISAKFAVLLEQGLDSAINNTNDFNLDLLHKVVTSYSVWQNSKPKKTEIIEIPQSSFMSE